MRWTVRGVSADTKAKAREMAGHLGSLGAVVEKAVGRLYEAEDWRRAPLDDDDDLKQLIGVMQGQIAKVIQLLGSTMGDPARVQVSGQTQDQRSTRANDPLVGY